MIPEAQVPEALGSGPRNALADFWDSGKQATLRKMAVDCAKCGHVRKLAQLLRDNEPAVGCPRQFFECVC